MGRRQIKPKRELSQSELESEIEILEQIATDTSRHRTIGEASLMPEESAQLIELRTKLGNIQRQQQIERWFHEFCRELVRHQMTGDEVQGIVVTLQGMVRAGIFRGSAQAQAPVTKTAKGNRRQRTPAALTERQIQAMKVFDDTKGNAAEAARQMNVCRKTAQQHYHSALRKLGFTAAQYAAIAKTQSIPHDARGQVNVADADDGPAAIGARPRVCRKVR